MSTADQDKPRPEHHPNEPFIPWQWWSGETYLAGFLTKANAESYGRAKGWIK